MAVDVVCLGELLIDFVSVDRDVSLIESSGFSKAPGGAPANVAAGAARLGVSAGFVGKVGQDPFGYYLKKILDDIPVDTSYLVFDDYARTTLSFVAQKSDGVRDCMFYRNPGADMLLAPEEIDEDYIAGAKVFHFGSISLGSPQSKAATLQAIEYARKHGLLISYDPNLRLSLWDDEAEARRQIDEGFAYAHVVKISEEEYPFIIGCDTIEACADYILDKGAQLVIVTLGEKGCYYSDGVHSGYVEGFPVQVLESTGAGDAFVASVLTYLGKSVDKNKPIRLTADEALVQALTFANGAGALATTVMGAIPSLPTVEAVNAFIATYERGEAL